MVLPQLVDLVFQDINLTLENCCVCHLATLIAPFILYAKFNFLVLKCYFRLDSTIGECINAQSTKARKINGSGSLGVGK